uniref:Transmembrane protein 126A n=1 Tax=Clastoptera arizonana TaxID=38151 RepID=A0A1B6CHJ7_9HEMI
MAYIGAAVLIEKASLDKIPPNVVRVSREEALQMQLETIYNWKPQIDIWPLRYGPMVLSALAGISTITIMNRCRNIVKLKTYGRFSMFLPTVFFPSLFCPLLHNQYVMPRILLNEDCPVCTQTRAMILQCVSSVFYPLILSPIGSFYYAMVGGSYNVPPLERKYLPELLKLWWTMVYKLRTNIKTLLGINAIIVSGLTYLEAKSFYNIQEKIYQDDKRFQEKLDLSYD